DSRRGKRIGWRVRSRVERHKRPRAACAGAIAARRQLAAPCQTAISCSEPQREAQARTKRVAAEQPGARSSPVQACVARWCNAGSLPGVRPGQLAAPHLAAPVAELLDHRSPDRTYGRTACAITPAAQQNREHARRNADRRVSVL